MKIFKLARAAIVAVALALMTLVALPASPAHADWPAPGQARCGMAWSYSVPSPGKIRLKPTYRCTPNVYAIGMGMTWQRSGRVLDTGNKQCADSTGGVPGCTYARTFNDPPGLQTWGVGVHRTVWRCTTCSRTDHGHWFVSFRH